MSLDLEKEYNNRARVPEHPGIIASWARDSAAYRETNLPRALRYGDGERHTFDLFEAGPGPTLMYIHGGYWQALDKNFHSIHARGLNQLGVSVAAERISACRPASTSCGPNATRPAAPAGSMANPPSKLACSPRLSAAIWWQTLHETPSAASACCGAAGARFANTCPRPPAAAASKRAIGMWHVEHLSSIAPCAPGWSTTSRRTAACQYGSRAAFAIMVDRQSNPIEMSSPVGAVIDA